MGETNEPLAWAEDWQMADPGFASYSNKQNQQRLALATIYYATTGIVWTNNTGWLSYDIDECQWFSQSPVDQVCDDEGNYLHLHLNNNNLVGTIPAETGFLSNLIFLDLSSNSLNSTIPSSLQTLTSLYYINLAYNTLNGSIPLAIWTQLTNLTQLGLSNNMLTGSIPSEIGGLQR